MNQFVGKKCPYCKTEFSAQDEVVVCSICDMPHHKDCWIENQGCTTFGCLGTMQAPGSDNATTSRDEIIDLTDFENKVYCTKCGAENDNNNIFCASCGNTLKSVIGNSQISSQPSVPFNNANYNYTNNYADDFVEQSKRYTIENEEYYTKQFSDMKRKNSTVSWNWIAFLFSPWWLIYRKMYDVGIAMLVVFAILNFFNSAYIVIIDLIVYIVFGIIGNNLYMKRIEKHINAENALSPTEKDAYFRKHSGVDKNALIYSIVIYVAVSLISYIF